MYRLLLKINMKKIILALLVTGMLWGCGSTETKPPEPHLELGQRISFVGAEPEKTYVIVGYRHFLEDKTDKHWQNHEYLVISYINDQGDMKTGTIHKNSVLKR